MIEKYFRQCELRRGDKRTTTWIPEKFAQKRRPVKLKDDSGKWEDGWVVEKVGVRERESVVRMMEDAHRRQRGESDI